MFYSSFLCILFVYFMKENDIIFIKKLSDTTAKLQKIRFFKNKIKEKFKTPFLQILLFCHILVLDAFSVNSNQNFKILIILCRGRGRGREGEITSRSSSKAD